MNPTIISQTKHFRQALDRILQEIKQDTDLERLSSCEWVRASRERALAITKIQEAIMWLGMDLKAINEECPGSSPSPYPESYNPVSPKIEPTADGLSL